MPLHLDYRPKTLDDVIGNDGIKESLQTIFARKDRPHTYLFSGPSGCGKTTIGRIIKEMLGCSDSDFMEYNSANTRGIDTVRDVMQNCHYSPIDGPVKVYLFDECHQWLAPVQNAILKFLEDTPEHVYAILCTTEPDRLIKTIHTRCTSYQVKTLSDKNITKLILNVVEKENITDFSDKVVKEIVRVAEGCPRQALVILDQVIDILDEESAVAAVSSMSFGEAEVLDICRAVYQGEKWDTFKVKLKAVEGHVEPESIRHAVLGYLNTILLSKDDGRAAELINLFSENTFYSGKPGITYMCYMSAKL